MRTWLYNHLTTDSDLETLWEVAPGGLSSRIVPRESQGTINLPKPFIVYGIGTNTNEALSEDPDHEAHRQFFQIWIHDEGGSYDLIDDTIEVVKARLKNASDPASKVMTTRWLETSQEFSNETYNTIFRYIRFQSIIGKGVTTA